MQKLHEFMDKRVIKVITGMRRCGKSTLLELLHQDLLKRGITKKQIVHINFESLEYEELCDYKTLYTHITGKIPKKKKSYILLDEIQMVEGWERAINSLFSDYQSDIYITGSNAYLLSSELSTLISGRYVEIKMLPLSFAEYLDFNQFQADVPLDEKFRTYIKYGALPAISELNKTDSVMYTFLNGIYNTVIMKDVVQRNSVKDVSLLTNLVHFLAHSNGSIISPKKISDYLTSSGRKTTSETICNYLLMLENAYIIYKLGRYDIKGKQYLKTLEKYYFVDTGIRNAVLGYRDADYGHIIESIIYFELLRRGYSVSLGKFNDYEIDFIASNQHEKKYYQVCLSILDESVLKREERSLLQIHDNHEKIILTLDSVPLNSSNGIKYCNVINFLLGNEPFSVRHMTEEEIDEMVIAQADDDSAWEAPIKVKRNKSYGSHRKKSKK